MTHVMDFQTKGIGHHENWIKIPEKFCDKNTIYCNTCRFSHNNDDHKENFDINPHYRLNENLIQNQYQQHHYHHKREKHNSHHHHHNNHNQHHYNNKYKSDTGGGGVLYHQNFKEHSKRISANNIGTDSNLASTPIRKMSPISEKRSPPIIKETTKENIGNSKNLCDKLNGRVPEILDFRESWMQEIDYYKEQIKGPQLLTEHNHIHTPDGNCAREIANESIKIIDTAVKRRLRTISDSEPNCNGSINNKFRQQHQRETNCDDELVLKRAREEPLIFNNNHYHVHQQQQLQFSIQHYQNGRNFNANVDGSHRSNGILNHQQNGVAALDKSSVHMPYSGPNVIKNPYHTNLAKGVANNKDHIVDSNNVQVSPPELRVAKESFTKQLKTKASETNSIVVAISAPSQFLEAQCAKSTSATAGAESLDDDKETIALDLHLETPQKDQTDSECSDIDDTDTDDFNENDGDNISDSFSDSDDEGYKGHTYLINPIEEFETSQLESSFSSFENNYTTPSSPFTPSLFANVPPYLTFSSHIQKGPTMPPEVQKILKWKVTSVMPKVVRRVIINSGCRLIKKTNDWVGTWEKHMKSPIFKTLRSYQKFNHMPGTFKIGRKDSVWRNLRAYISKFGKKEFGFMQKTYILPQELKSLKRVWPKYSQKNTKWIVKPPASARGTGIQVISRWSQIPKSKPLIVQKYIERPLLIHGSKFDLRLYVVVTSVNPLRIYMYPDGLARFASVQYSDNVDTLNDRCMHLTNYSINKLSENYAKNEDVNACQGHKWTLKSLWSYFQKKGVNTKRLWGTLRNLVIRTIVAGEGSLNKMFRMNVNSRYNCYELLGFDVLLDEDLIPWLLEVNISPSLHSELPLDLHIKGPLVQAVLNTALYQVPPKLSEEQQQRVLRECRLEGRLCYDKRLYVTHLSQEEKIKHNYFTSKDIDCREEYIESILDNLTPDDIRCLIISEDELARSAPLERIFPGPSSYKYLPFTEGPRYYNRLVDAWEYAYGSNRQIGIQVLQEYCFDKIHLEVAPAPQTQSNKETLQQVDTCDTQNDNKLNTTSADSLVLDTKLISSLSSLVSQPAITCLQQENSTQVQRANNGEVYTGPSPIAVEIK